MINFIKSIIYQNSRKKMKFYIVFFLNILTIVQTQNKENCKKCNDFAKEIKSKSNSAKIIPTTATIKTTIATTLKENLTRNLKQSRIISTDLSDKLSQESIILVLGLLLVTIFSILTLFIFFIRKTNKRNKVPRNSIDNLEVG